MHFPYMYGDTAALFLLGTYIVKCINRFLWIKEHQMYITVLCVFVIIAKSQIKFRVPEHYYELSITTAHNM